jgi:hypothetical protein
MPQQKGRKHRQKERRHARTGSDDAAPPGATTPKQPARASQQLPDGVRLPSATARATGFMVAIVTAIVAVLMMLGALGGGGAEAIVRLLVAVFLLGLAAAVGALCLAPLWVRSLIVRQR